MHTKRSIGFYSRYVTERKRDLEKTQGYVEHIVYRNEDNGYTVFQLENEDGELTCVGNFTSLSEGEMLEVSGEYTNHNLYGLQLKVSAYEFKEPEDVISIERYLGSGAIKGIGVKMAGKIVDKFRGDTFRIIEEEPERLAEIKGISLKKAMDISVQLEEKRDMRKAMIFLQKYGISVTLGAKIYERYGRNVYQVIEENPYQIADQIQGVGFKTADEIAAQVGIRPNSEFRIRSGLLYTLQQSASEGHIYLPADSLLYRTSRLLETEISDLEKHLMDLNMEKKIVLKETEGQLRVYPARLYYLELHTAAMLDALNVSYDLDEESFQERLEKIRKSEKLDLDVKQRTAVLEAARNGLFILTGGPGTGKTTTINTMIHFFERLGMDIRLAAPTGRAAKRMTETTGYEAQTIHRLLEVSGNPEEAHAESGFSRNKENPLETDVIIIDEMSMVDLPLMHALLEAISVGTRLILVGDQNQLPSVGPGSVLKDMIRSERFAIVKLTKIFRQAGESDIVVNAHKINAGELVVLDNKSKDFFFLKRSDSDVILRVVLALVQEKMPRYVNADPLEIQVLTPMKKGLLGVERLNAMLQRYLNPPSPEKKETEQGGRLFREGDKVMQIKNNYQLEWEIRTARGLTIDSGQGVFNGDMGVIREIDPFEETVEVEFDEQRRITYPFAMLEELELAYAITIHKAQGSEYPAVVLPLLPGPRLLYNRNLLYTAVTRAKKCITIVGSEETFQEMIQNKSEQERYTSLDERIREF